MRKVLLDLGLKLVENISIKGKSGINYFFKFAVRSSSEIMAIIHILKHLTTEEVCKVYACKIDTEIPQLIIYLEQDDEAVEIASQLNVGVFIKNNLGELRKFILKFAQ